MNYEYYDTLNANQQNQENNDQHNADKSKNKEAMVAKLLASAAAGAVIGSGSTYAATTLFGNKTEEPETQEEQDGAEAQPAEEEAQATPAQDNTEERLARIEEQERIRQQHEAERQQQEQARQEQEQLRQQHEEARQKEESQAAQPKPTAQPVSQTTSQPEIKIVSIEERTDNEGNTIHIATGTVDGHQAIFGDDGHGNLVGAAIDVNDNGIVDENEIIDLRPSNMTMNDLAQYRVEVPEHEADIQVVAVEHGVDIDGQVVDVAAVDIDGEHAVLIDSDQDNEINFVVSDRNGNGTIENAEIQDVSDAHITMPSEDDVTGNVMAAGNDAPDIPDYCNDADTAMYDV